ncbi:MAG: MBL fold metallo-hydrolase [Candidatus Riflebacteria bacterium]|nr:MBL fold metallo-hydrolase [Candidatus Riflebacteria bacterium]
MNHRSAKLTLLLLLGVFFCSAVYADVRVTFLDVTQGDCIIIRNGAKTIMIDAGDDNRDAAARYIIPYFKKEGIKKVDQAIITHPHRDHFGGFIELVKQFKFGEFVYSNDTDVSSDGKAVTRGSNDAIVYDGLRSLIKSKNIPYRKAQLGELLDWGEGIKAEVLSCDNPKLYRALREEDPKKGAINPNEISIVIKMTYGKVSYLFTGDAEKKAETEMVERFGKKLHVDVLKSGHHGSKTSSNHNFMDAVQPTYGVIQVGKGNSFGHPTQQTLDVYNYYKMKVFRNDYDGTVESFTDGNKIEFVSNQSAIQFASKPKVIALTPNSATLQWTTNREATSAVEYSNGQASKKKVNESATKTHTITLVGLKPNTDYTYTAISIDPRESSKVIKCQGTIKTPAGSGTPMASIAAISTNFDRIYMKHPFKAIVNIKNPAETKCDGLVVEIYHSAMNASNLIDKINLSVPAKSTNAAVSNTKIDWLGNIELIAVLKKGNTIIDTATKNINIEPKLVFVDCSHGNKDYFTGRFAGMKMDLFQHYGFQLKSISKAINYETIKDAFMVMIPHPSTSYTTEELNALKKFSKAGGSILMFGQSDYSNKSHPEIQNKVLAAIGSTIRFNDDQVCDPTNNIGAPFRFFVSKFPSSITKSDEMSKLLFRTCCSLINSNGSALKNQGRVTVVAMADEDSFNQESDEKNDGYKYAGGNIPVAAVEDLGVGRVGCIGENTYQDSLYGGTSNKGLCTPAFNRSICYWLSLGKEKTLRALTRSIAELDYEDDPEVRATQYESLSKAVIRNVRRSMEEGGKGLSEIKREMDYYQGESINQLKRQIQQLDTYENIYNNKK